MNNTLDSITADINRTRRALDRAIAAQAGLRGDALAAAQAEVVRLNTQLNELHDAFLNA